MNKTIVVFGKSYTFDSTQDQILKRGILDPYTISEKTNEWVVLDPYIYWSARFQREIIIPRWMITDLASIPQMFQWLISVNERHRLASLPHDFGYIIASTTLRKRKEWDLILKDFCKQQGVNWWKTQAIYWAVRAGGWYPWKTPGEQMYIPYEDRLWYRERFPNLALDERPGDFYIV